MFAYCNNNPIIYADHSGCSLWPTTVAMNDNTGGCRHSGTSNCEDAIKNNEQINRGYNSLQNIKNTVSNDDISTVYEAEYFSFYKGALVIRHNIQGLTSCAIFGVIFLNHKYDDIGYGEQAKMLNHEYGHILQEKELGSSRYIAGVAIPSFIYYGLSRNNPALDNNYYNMPWEYDADMRGMVTRGEHADWASSVSDYYISFLRSVP